MRARGRFWLVADEPAEEKVALGFPRPGLRLSLLLLLGSLMVVTYVPLFFATSTYTRLGLEQLQRDTATKLATSVASHLALSRVGTSQEAVTDLARAEIEKRAVHALSLLDAQGNTQIVLGDVELLKGVSRETGFGAKAEKRQLTTPLGPAILVYEPSARGGVAAVVRVDAEITRAGELARLMGLYMAVGALALLATAYFALTRWIVRPILQLERGASRVAAGGTKLSSVSGAPRELAHLAEQLQAMTRKLKADEIALRDKVDELQARTQELHAAQNSLVRSERLATVGRLAAGLAHEVGNPISALMGLQELMKDEATTEAEKRDYLERMSRETARIHRVLSDLLAYARPSANASSAAAGEPGSLKEAVAHVLALLAPQPVLQHVRIRAQVSENLPTVPLSQEELTQILLNLLMNACDACEKQGNIQVLVSEASGGQVSLVVEDDGPGVATAVEDSLFEPFVSTKDVGKGTGLGLAVTKGLVEAAGGTIQVSRVTEQGGARFVILLPRAIGSNS